jgi:hypothetical protein
MVCENLKKDAQSHLSVELLLSVSCILSEFPHNCTRGNAATDEAKDSLHAAAEEPEEGNIDTVKSLFEWGVSTPAMPLAETTGRLRYTEPPRGTSQSMSCASHRAEREGGSI